MGNVGLPGTSGFVGEILTMTGAYGVSTWTAIFAATGVIFSAVYALTLYRRVVFGTITNPKLADITDLDWREVAIFAPLIISTLALGVFPSSVFNLTQASVDQLVTVYRAAIGG
jgi:NADH-quinone oxidoreductase subunit M